MIGSVEWNLSLVILPTGGYPWIAAVVLTAGLLYWLVAGKVVIQSGRVWADRREQPRKYWALVGVLGVLILCLWVLGILVAAA